MTLYIPTVDGPIPQEFEIFRGPKRFDSVTNTGSYLTGTVAFAVENQCGVKAYAKFSSGCQIFERKVFPNGACVLIPSYSLTISGTVPYLDGGMNSLSTMGQMIAVDVFNTLAVTT